MYLLVILTVIEREAIVALYNKSLEAISFVCFEHVQCTVYSWLKKGCRHQQSPVFNTLTQQNYGLIKGGQNILFTLAEHKCRKAVPDATTLQQSSSPARYVSRNCCYVWDPIYAGETRNFLQLIRSLYPTNLSLSLRSTLSLQRHFLTATLSFIDRGCYLEKQKDRGGGRTGKGGGAGRKKKNKSLASKAYEITECPLISRAWLLFRKCKHSHWKSISFLFSKASSYFRQLQWRMLEKALSRALTR